MPQEYQRLGTGSSRSRNEEETFPSSPPRYNDIDGNYERNESSSAYMEQFEIEEPVEEQSLLNRAHSFSKKFANNVQTRIIHPVTRMIDPIYEGYKFLQLQYERSILKLGNPLVIKRLLYVLVMMVIVFGISKYGSNDTLSGVTSGFARGKFYDVEKLAGTVGKLIDTKAMKEHLEYFSSIPHMSGSKGDLALARYIEKYMKNNGLHNVEINEFQSFINYPSKKDTFLRLADGSFEATLFEKHNENMEFLSFNPNGLNTVETITTEYLYVNFGRDEDFQRLTEHGVNVKGKILLVKYGGNVPEPNKIFTAAKHEAKAVVFITPKLEASDNAIQRSNVGLTRMASGDILTPGWSSEDGYVSRLSWEKSEITPKIPSIPISWKDGQALVKKLSGGFNFEDGSSGDGNSPSPKLNLKVSDTDRPVHPIWNVVGSIGGREQGEKGVIIGSQRDALCYGTMGCNTGVAAFLELIKIFTSLQRRYQWSPSRSIHFVSFDATDYNLAGSTEWIENRKEPLRKDGYLYIDLSDLVTGDELHINMHPFLKEVLHDALGKVTTGDKTLLSLIESQGGASIENTFMETKNYLPFINLVNMPALEVKYRGKNNQVKNTCYDNFQHFEDSDIDRSMSKHSQLVELIARIVMEFAEAPWIPYNFLDLSDMLNSYEQDLEKYASSITASLTVKPLLHYDGLKRSIALLKDVSSQYHQWVSDWKSFIFESGGLEPPMYSMMRWRWNDNMIDFNSNLLKREIHPKRPGYKNMLFGLPFNAPADDPGEFAWNTMPFIREALSQGDFSRAQEEINLLALALEDAAKSYSNLH
ncbi:uncharacterized protein LODBEIA_P49390 [Lodderomyces beijingensis]|uniref:FXNA-related family protease 1 n=1 Tax=Lodderomyces beijingensis TaxID=1775926 RepID=A0ABP0ZU33_9ASCO